jgi:Na+/melibiose symporter-like transporter
VTWVGLIVPPPMNYTVTTFAFAFFYVLGIFFIRWASKPYDLPVESLPSVARPSVTAGDMVKAITTNSQLLIYLLSSTLSMTGMMIMMNIAIYYWQLIVPFTHGVAPSESFPKLYTIGNTMTTVASFCFAMLGRRSGLSWARRTPWR